MGNTDTREERGWSWRLRVVGTLLSLILLAWLFIRQDWQAILTAVQTLPAWSLIASLFLVLLRHIWNNTRWYILLRAQKIDISFLRALQLMFTGLFVSNFLPSMVGGDVVRIAGILQETEKRVAGAASVLMDRLVGVTGMFFVLPLSFPLIGAIISDPDFLFTSSIAGFSKKLRSGYKRLWTVFRIWMRKPFSLVFALITSWLGVLSSFLAVLILARGLGMSVSLLDIAGVSVLTYFLTLIPISINGYGIRELAILGFYTQLGASSEQATALALITRFIFLLVSLPGAFWLKDIVPAETSTEVDVVEEAS
ncbi:MAG: flippase-like domain-containing protein [Anaerolineales bacterium]|nr:flippase-like domain-containing protein [Anaerolineales bacterium]